MKNRAVNLLSYLWIPLVIVMMAACSNDNSVGGDVPDPDFDYGTDRVSLADWNFDQTHSSVRWESLYLGSSALLTGRFNDFTLEEFEFQADDPEDIKFTGTVVLSTVNTGEPGRDQGCLLGTFGIDETGDEAKITTNSVTFDGVGGYDVDATLDFHGYSQPVFMKLVYSGSTFFAEDSGIHGAPFTVVGFAGTFEFNALSDFGIESDNIADRVLVSCNIQFKKPG